jgi:hypothetical protein
MQAAKKNSGVTIVLTYDGETGILPLLACVLVTLFSNSVIRILLTIVFKWIFIVFNIIKPLMVKIF